MYLVARAIGSRWYADIPRLRSGESTFVIRTYLGI